MPDGGSRGGTGRGRRPWRPHAPTRRPRWHRRGLIRLTPAGVVLAVVAGGLWYLALLLDDRALIGGALAATVSWCLGLALAVAQYAAIRAGDLGGAEDDDAAPTGRPGECDVTVRASGLRRLLLPHRVSLTDQYVRLDAGGRCVSRHVGMPADRRGWYRHLHAVARWNDPFGLFAVRRPLARDDDVVMLPVPERDEAARLMAADDRPRGRTRSENTGGVRAYAPGDPPKLIAWRHSAHLGTLMTRETGYEVESTAVIVVDTLDASAADVDAAAAKALAMLSVGPSTRGGAGESSRRTVVTDGGASADDPPHILRLLAALTPADADAADRHAETIRRADAVAELASHGRGDVSVTLLTAHPQGALAGELRARIPEGGLHIVPVDGDAADAAATYRRIALHLSDAPAASGVAAAPIMAVPAAGGEPLEPDDPADEPHPNHRRIAQAATAVSLLALFLTSVGTATDIAAPTGWWPWFAAAALAVVAVESSIRWRTSLRGAWRVLGMTLAVMLAAVVTVTLRIRTVAGVWPADGTAMTAFMAASAPDGADPSAMPAPPDAPSGVAAPLTTAWRTVVSVLAWGFEGLRAQLPPLDVDPAGDVFLIVLCSLIIVIVRCLLFWRAAAPGVALLAVTVLGADYGLVGHGAAWWRIALTALAFAVLLWSRGPWRALPATGLTSAALAVAVTLASTPAALDMAYAVPLSFGTSGGLFSSTTINPMIDLKRSLDEGSTATALTYTADRRLYLRMTTLGAFDGDTWRFDDALARDGAFYGSVIQLGRDESNMMTGMERWQGAFSPVEAYRSLIGARGSRASGGSGQDYTWGAVGSTAESLMLGRGYPSLDGLTESGSVTIEALNSRFLPVPGITQYVNGAAGWSTYSDGTVYSRDGSAAQGTDYTAYGIYFDPISTANGFSQVETVHDWGEALTNAAEPTDEDWRQRREARQALVDAGVATAERGWVLMPVDVADDGGVTDSAGATVGSFGALGTQRDLVLDAGFIDRVRLGFDESFIVSFDRDGRCMLALSADDPETAFADVGVVTIPMPEEWGGETFSFDPSRGGTQSAEETALSYITYVLWARGMANRGIITYEGVTARDEDADGGRDPYDSYGYGTYGYYDGYDTSRVLDYLDASETTIHDRYTTLPDDLPGPVRAVVDAARADGVAGQAEGYDQQIAAMRWLVDYFTDPANGFVYSLDAPDGDGRDNLDVIADFLTQRSGYCSHYAAALAVLGRALGVPTRMVLGYAPGSGEAERGGDTYAVAANQLHSWTEAYIDGVGWVPFDVTPASPDGDADEAAIDTTTVDDGAQDADASDDATDPAPTPDADADAQADGAGPAETDASEPMQSDAATDVAPVTADAGTPHWAAVAAWIALAIALAAALLAVPGLVRRRRRIRRLRIIEDSAGSPPDDAGAATTAGVAPAVGTGPSRITDFGRTRVPPPDDAPGAHASADSPADADAVRRRAWVAAWRELTDTARDCGLRWSDTDTDLDVARHIAAMTADAGAASAAAAADETESDAAPFDGDRTNRTNRANRAEAGAAACRGCESAKSFDAPTASPVVGIALHACESAFGGTVAATGGLAATVRDMVAAIEAAADRRSRHPAAARWRRLLFPASLRRGRR